MIELYTDQFEKITFQRGVNIFTFVEASQSERFVEYIEEAFIKRKKTSHLHLLQENEEKGPKDYYPMQTAIGKHAQEVKLHDVLIEKLVYDFYHDKQQMKAYYDFQCQYQAFLNRLEMNSAEYDVLFHSENFQEKQFLKQLEFDITKKEARRDASDRIKIYCDTKQQMNEHQKEPVTIIPYPETEVGLKELAQIAAYTSELPGYVIIITNTMHHFTSLKNQAHYNIFNNKSTRVQLEALVEEYRLFDPLITERDVIQIVECYLTGNTHLIDKKYDKMVKSSGINEADMV